MALSRLCWATQQLKVPRECGSSRGRSGSQSALTKQVQGPSRRVPTQPCTELYDPLIQDRRDCGHHQGMLMLLELLLPFYSQAAALDPQAPETVNRRLQSLQTPKPEILKRSKASTMQVPCIPKNLLTEPEERVEEEE